ncbi:hypothetical protein OG596_38820 (plasmid) [Streptomyces sp. NBC_01102]|uniref:hypothetical protein n=1 Tax=Streptomyces sp. NBC_01102 TaxID=2903749 RepID=UPI002F909F53|nr:hypothetical protein OG596_38820 [Streptomyces sp. NBC_01102]
MAAGALQIVFKGTPNFGGVPVRCPESGSGPSWGTTVIRLYVTPAGVLGSCGQTHRPRGDDGRKAKPAECAFQVEAVTKEELQALAAPNKTGRVRGKLPTGKALDVQIISFGAPPAGAAQASGGKAAQAFAAAKNGKGAAPAAPARVARGGGGAMTAFFGAIAATAGAAGQIAGAAGQVAGSAASIVGSAADLGKEGVGLARDGVREAGAYGGRRHERKMRDTGSDD